MELTGTVHLSLLDPILAKRIEQWIEERIEIGAAIDEADNSTNLEILEWLLAEIGLWPEEEGAPNDQADPAPGG